MKELSYFEKSEEILEMDNKKLDEICGLVSHIEKRLYDLETYIHGPTRKPYDWEEK